MGVVIVAQDMRMFWIGISEAILSLGGLMGLLVILCLRTV